MTDQARVAWLTDRVVVRLTGADIRNFLQGLITNDIAKLTPDHALWAAMLTPQGRYLVDFFIIQQNDAILLDVDTHAAEALIKKLSMYRLRADVHINLTDDHIYAHFSGTAAPPISGMHYADTRSPLMGQRIITLASTPPNIITASAADYNLHRLRLGIPDGAKDAVAERSLMLELGYDILGAVSFTKGCYVGQEVTARSKHRGELRKALYCITSTHALPAAGTPVMADGDELGELRSSEGNIGLALLRTDRVDALGANIPILAENTPVQLSIPQWRQA